MSTAPARQSPQQTTRQQSRPAQQNLPPDQQKMLENIMAQVREVEYRPLGGDSSIKLSVAAIRRVFRPRTKNGIEATDEDIMQFMMLCKSKNLNPFENDAYLIGYEEQGRAKWTLITSIYAFLKRAEVNPNYNGIQSGIITQSQDGAIQEREGDFLLPGESLLGGWAKVHRKDRQYPNYKKVTLKTYHTGQSRWKNDPAGMICKVAECQALRDTFPTSLGGLYVSGEMDATIHGKQPESKPAQLAPPVAARVYSPAQEEATVEQLDEAEMVSEAMLDEIQMHFARIGSSEEAIRQTLAKYGVSNAIDMTVSAAGKLIAELNKIESMREPGEEG